MHSSLQNVMKAQKRLQLYLYRFFNLGSRRYWLSTPRADRLSPRERQLLPITGGYVGSMASLDGCKMPRPHRISNPQLSPLRMSPYCLLYSGCLPSPTAECYSYFGLPSDGFSRVFTVPMVCTNFFAPAVHHLSLLVGSSS